MKLIVIDLHSRTPVYEQIKDQIIALINKGVYKSGDKLPSIRTLANELELNVNTIKRVFQELEFDGVVYTQAGKGIFVSDNAVNNENVRHKAIESLTVCIRSAISKGVSKDEIELLLSQLYDIESE